LILKYDCCLWSWWVSLGLWRRQQNPASEASLLPLRLVGFIGSRAEAANSYFRDEIAAFALGGFHWVYGGGSEIPLLRRDCCLCAWWVSSGSRRWQQNPAYRGAVAAFVLGGFLRVNGGGSKILLTEAQLLPLRLEGYSSGSRRWQQISMF
jgi:hypothetical protein